MRERGGNGGKEKKEGIGEMEERAEREREVTG